MTDAPLSLWRGDVLVTTYPTMRETAQRVAARYALTLDDLKGPSRHRRIVRPRQEACWIMRQAKKPDGSPRYSLPQIGQFFGDRDHSTILHAIRQHQARSGGEGA